MSLRNGWRVALKTGKRNDLNILLLILKILVGYAIIIINQVVGGLYYVENYNFKYQVSSSSQILII